MSCELLITTSGLWLFSAYAVPAIATEITSCSSSYGSREECNHTTQVIKEPDLGEVLEGFLQC